MSKQSKSQRQSLKSGRTPAAANIKRVGLSRPAMLRVDLIFQKIASGKYPNCTTLARELEVTPKTIHADIKFMKEQRDLPVEYDEVQHGYYFNGPVNRPVIKLTKGELLVMFMARKALEPVKGSRLKKIITTGLGKIAEACPEEVSVDAVELDAAFSVGASGSMRADVEQFEKLLDAALNGKEVVFEYHKLAGKNHEARKLRPYAVVQLNQGWYVIGYDVDRGDMRKFALPRMRALKATRVKFQRPADFKLSEHLNRGFGVWSYGKETEGKEYQVKIKLNDWAARYVLERDWHEHQEIVRLKEDGSEIEFRVKVAGLEEITSWVLGFGSKAQVLAPLSLRNRVRDELTEMARMYEVPSSY
ncbi:MAG: WYL domain-containing protein [Verrucomicrobiaceae bacterium]|nr:WYL domain-containing protein [Verrucomicrobiaceae bacterium]